MKQKIQGGILVAFLLGLLAFYVVIGNTQNSAFKIGNVQWSEKELNLYRWSGAATYLEYNDVTYCFKTDSFEEKTAKNIIGKIDQVVQYSNQIFPEDKPKVKIYVGFSKDDFYSDKTDLFIPLEQELSYDDIWRLLKEAHRNSINAAEQYGLFYVYCKEHHIIGQQSEDSSKKYETLRNFLEKDEQMYLIDFTLPMIENVYFDEETSELERECVAGFAEWFTQKYSFEEYEMLCKTIEVYDRELLTKRKNEWLQEIGSRKNYTELGKILFQYHDAQNVCSGATYKIETDDAIWNWDDLDVVTLGYVDMVTNYQIIEPLRIADFKEAREYLKDYLPKNLEKVNICTKFTQMNTIEDYCFYVPTSNTIMLTLGWEETAHALFHEYCHHLTMGDGKILQDGNSIFTEWFSTVLANFELKNLEKNIAFVNYMGEDFLREYGLWDEKNNCYSCSNADMRDAWKGYQERLEKDPYFIENKNIAVISTAGLNYSEKCVLAEYVVKTYGFDKLVELAKQDGDFENVLGCSFIELYADTIEWIQDEIGG